ncbi:unnamed protein product [Allacma fusca]|uniref:Uncharacterized protein n=1 Tax=Allacma fusca TaxID=39272 RepID=A0A8J2JY56_9HEXA|nr:unnamed protein product [Allacma fusca]
MHSSTKKIDNFSEAKTLVRESRGKLGMVWHAFRHILKSTLSTRALARVQMLDGTKWGSGLRRLSHHQSKCEAKVERERGA